MAQAVDRLESGVRAACAQLTIARTSDVTISDFNQPIALAAPPSPLDLTSLKR